MKDFVEHYLEKRGYEVNTEALGIIGMCDDWYKNKEITDFHKRSNLNGKEINLSRMNFAKRGCSDDANLCEIVSVAPEKESGSQEFIDKFLSSNRFDVQYRKQLEKTSATGTTGAYIYLKNADFLDNGTAANGEIRINYCDADSIIPLTVENDVVIECAFAGTGKTAGKTKTTLVIFTLEEGRYKAETIFFDKTGKVEEESSIQLGEVKPFSILTNAEVNNLENMEGYGLPKIYNSIPVFKALDLCYNIMYGDLDKGEKLVFLNELLAEVKRRDDGSYMMTKKQQELFILLGEKLPEEKTLIHEYNPEIRVDGITKAFELLLSLLSMSFGYGTKKYTFENGKITTATEYIGTKQDSMQELNKQRKNAKDYITDLIHAAMWFSNTFHGTSYNLEEALSIEFDDSYVEDKQTKIESMRADAVTFADVPILLVWYLMERYNLSEEEARKHLEQKDNTEEEMEE